MTRVQKDRHIITKIDYSVTTACYTTRVNFFFLLFVVFFVKLHTITRVLIKIYKVFKIKLHIKVEFYIKVELKR